MGGKTVAYFYDPDVGNFHYGKPYSPLVDSCRGTEEEAGLEKVTKMEEE